MGLLRNVGGAYSLTPAGPIVPCNECVFCKSRRTSLAPAKVPPAAAPSPATPGEAQVDVPPSSSVDTRSDRIDTRIRNMEHMLQLLVAHFLLGAGQYH